MLFQYRTLFTMIYFTMLCDTKQILQDNLVRTVDVQAVEGMMAQFPCELGIHNYEKVYMVFWFRDDAGVPLYSFDVRGKHLSEARHWSAPEVFGPRAHFVTNPEPAALVVKDVKRRDEGVYRCRIDFRNAQTMSFRYNLTVIVPPEKPVVVDRWGRILNSSYFGPHEEGDDVLLTCRVLGGRPEPTVRWLVNGVAVDDEYEHNTGDVIENRLLWPSIRRQDYSAVFTCQASNSKMIPPKDYVLVLDMYLRPLTVEMKKPKLAARRDQEVTALAVGERYDFTCLSAGSRPSAQILWFKGKKLLKRTREEQRDNHTISELILEPEIDDDGKMITCRAENPNNTRLFMETSMSLNVVYAPQIHLRLGSTLSSDDIKEGDDVYFECHVKANPPWRKLTWSHNGIPLAHNTTARIIRSNQSLVLQKVTRHSSGNYTCSALNSEGEKISNVLNFRVKYAPTCRHSGVNVVGASRGEAVVIVCEVDADPPAAVFKWKFNNSGETLDVGANRYTNNGSASYFKYTPISDLDYGTLSCTASNSIGKQSAACVFQMVAAGKPNPVKNCTLSNYTSSSVEVWCFPGFDGGLPQQFILEVFTEVSEYPRYNLTSDEPVWVLRGLEWGVRFRLAASAFNAKGRSARVYVDDVLFSDPEKRTASEVSLGVSPAMGAGVGVACTALVLTCAIAFRARKSNGAGAAPHKEAPIVVAAQEKLKTPEQDDAEPDLIPNNFSEQLVPTQVTIASPIHPAAVPMMVNGPGSSWTWGARPRDLTLSGNGSTVMSHTIGRSTSAQLRSANDSLNVDAIKEKLLDHRIPESCV